MCLGALRAGGCAWHVLVLPHILHLLSAAAAPTPAAPSKPAGESTGAGAAASPGEDAAMADLEVDDPEVCLVMLAVCGKVPPYVLTAAA